MSNPSQLSLPLSIFDRDDDSDTNFGFAFTVRRSARRRTIELQISNGKVNLALPTFVSNAEGLEFVRKKRDWVLDTLAKQQKHLSEVIPKTYEQGEVFQYFGRQCPLNIILAKKSGAELLNGQILVSLTKRQLPNKAEAVQKTLWRWYQQQALEVFTHKTTQLANQWGLSFNKVQIRKTKSEWGHCTSDGVLQYNWLVMMAPEAVVDYLVAHEVSHLKHRNHSQTFWAHVEKLNPDYKAARKWLKDHGHTLTV